MERWTSEVLSMASSARASQASPRHYRRVKPSRHVARPAQRAKAEDTNARAIPPAKRIGTKFDHENSFRPHSLVDFEFLDLKLPLLPSLLQQ